MTDLDALNRAVCLAPDDDTPRGVYADALDDAPATAVCPVCEGACEVDGRPHDRDGPCPNCRGRGWVPTGYPERAAFIRAQCELARMQRPRDRATIGDLYAMVPPSRGGEVRYVRGADLAAANELAAKAQALFAALHPDDKYLRGGEGAAVRVDELRQWERGFPTTLVDIPGDYWCRHADMILTRAPIRAVELRTLPEVRFHSLIRSRRGNPAGDHGLTYVAKWSAECDGRANTFRVEQTIGEREILSPGGGDAVIRATRVIEEDIRDAMTPLGYVRGRWPKVRFTGPTGWQNGPVDPLGDLRAARERIMRGSLGMPVIPDPRAFIAPPNL